MTIQIILLQLANFLEAWLQLQIVPQIKTLIKNTCADLAYTCFKLINKANFFSGLIVSMLLWKIIQQTQSQKEFSKLRQSLEVFVSVYSDSEKELIFILFHRYIYPPDLQECDGGTIRWASNYSDLFLEMLRCCSTQ